MLTVDTLPGENRACFYLPCEHLFKFSPLNILIYLRSSKEVGNKQELM
jgi:hypothetical protein